MVEKGLHITELGGDPWILPVWSAGNEAIAANEFPELTADVHRLGLYI